MQEDAMTEQVCYPQVKNIGLRGIPVADTRISVVDGVQGELQYRGFSIEDLAGQATFEEVVYLLFYGKLPSGSQLDIFSNQLRAARALAPEIQEILAKRPVTAGPMDVLQGTVPLLADWDPDLGDASRESFQRQALRLTAQLATVLAAWHRIRKGLKPVSPRDDLGHAANFLYMLSGKEPSEHMARTLDICLVLHADHTFNASTFTARQVASSRAHMYASVAAAIGALSGELHGGANTRVMEMIMEIGSVDKVAEYIKARLDAGERIMGMGHAVYKTIDPRAPILLEMSRELCSQTGDQRLLEITEEVCRVTQAEFRTRKDMDIFPNVDFYSGITYSLMGIEPDLFTPMFAISRVAGWCAHVIEERFAEAQEKPALYRPKAEYIGEYCGDRGCTFTPLEERG